MQRVLRCKAAAARQPQQRPRSSTPGWLLPHPPLLLLLLQPVLLRPPTLRRVFAKMTDWVMARVSYRSHRVSSFQSSRSCRGGVDEGREGESSGHSRG